MAEEAKFVNKNLLIPEQGSSNSIVRAHSVSEIFQTPKTEENKVENVVAEPSVVKEPKSVRTTSSQRMHKERMIKELLESRLAMRKELEFLSSRLTVIWKQMEGSDPMYAQCQDDNLSESSKGTVQVEKEKSIQQVQDKVNAWAEHNQSQLNCHSKLCNHATEPDRRPEPANQAPAGTVERLISRLATPRELPNFGGDCIEWLHFKCAYEESSRVCSFSDSENLWRLRKALRGDAKEAVIDLLIGNTSPATVMEALELRFGRSELIVQKIAAQLRKLSPLPSYYQQEIFSFAVKVNNAVATIRALKQDDYLRSPELVSAVTSKLPCTLISKWTDYVFNKLSTGRAKLELLASFLKQEAEILCIVGIQPSTSELKKIPTTEPNMNNYDKYRNKSVFTTSSIEQPSMCKFCSKSNHLLPECRTFKRALRKDKWKFVKIHKLCYTCLGSARHDRNTCPAPLCNVDNCGMSHHRLLHWKKPTNDEPGPQSADEAPPADEATVAHVIATPSNIPTSAAATSATCATSGAGAATPLRASSDVMLKVLSVKLRGPNGIEISTYALLDDAASVSIIDSELADQLGLQCEKSSDIKFLDAFGLEIYQTAVPTVCAEISGQNKNRYNIKLRKICKLNLPEQNLSVINSIDLDYLSTIKDGVCRERVIPRLLIGEDNYFLIAPLEMIHGSRNAPYATRCRLGWSIHGFYSRTAHTQDDAHVSQSICCLSHSNSDNGYLDHSELNSLIKQSFSIDSIGISTVCRENTAHTRALQIIDETARHINSEWEVGLPFKSDSFTMPDSYDYALCRQKSLLRKFEKDPIYAERYTKEIENLIDQGYAKKLTNIDQLMGSHNQYIWYLPHFGVQNPNKPGKLRLVFDAAAKVKGHCLNDFLLTGPDLYNSLLGIMFRFRENPIAFTGDIKDMFLRIKIRAQDQNALRFLWNDVSESEPSIYVMQSLIFGATCSPFIAQHVKNKNALKFDDRYPEAVDVIINSHYMDDCVHSTTSEEKAKELISQISEIHDKGGFHIRGWTSNSRKALENISAGDLAHNAILFNDGSLNHTQRTLGLLWNPSDDCFSFRVSFDRLGILTPTQPPTKAKMLSVIMSIYDIHGFLSPFLIKSKILLQNVHRTGIKWESHILHDDFMYWLQWLEELKQVASLRIPRWYLAGSWTPCYSPPAPLAPPSPSSATDNDANGIIHTQMHIFCDASIKAFAAVIYWRLTRADGTVNVCFAASKSRVTPLTPVSVPRLELQGALLGARLATSVQKEHKDMPCNKRFFWTDSSTVLQWIRSDPRTYKPYVAHRLGEIDELTSVTEWRYVPSRLNVADKATKSDTPPLSLDDVWFQGPAFLRSMEDCWPKDLKQTKLSNDATVEVRNVLVLSSRDTNLEFSLPKEDNFSSWLRLVRSTARVLFFIRKCQRKNVNFDVNLLKEAENLLLKKSQLDSFPDDVLHVGKDEPLPRNSRLLKLTPYLDNAGLLRVGGRIDNAMGIQQSIARPVVLDGRHKITRLIVEYYHRRALHGANEHVVNELRQRYWVVNLRPTVRAVAAHCFFCRYRRAIPRAQRMADLPPSRLQHYRRPFSCSGVDFFGPMEITVGRRRLKRYGMLFTCLTVRAVHIEVTDNLTADSAIMAIRRMSARRGTPSIIYSDNGTNLRGANTELKKSLEELNVDKVREDGSVRGIEWRFIPPGAPEMGGAWERLIRTVKSALKVVLKERAPSHETLITLMAEVEALVNSRPLTHVSTDPNYPEALTPNHFLIGSSSTGPPFGKYVDFDLQLRKQWRVAQRLADMFWLRWTNEYLPTLLPRQKWTTEERALKVGDYVVIADPKLERGSWRHGVVSAALAGADGRVRVVDVRTRTGLLRRPVTRVALLTPSDSSAANP